MPTRAERLHPILSRVVESETCVCCISTEKTLDGPFQPMISHRHPRTSVVGWGNVGRRYRAAPCRAFVGERWGKQVELFLSTYVNKVDRKGRVSVPATFRSTLATHREPPLIVPETLKDYANITTDVAFVGLGAMFQMWEPGRYAEHRATVRERSRRQGT